MNPTDLLVPAGIGVPLGVALQLVRASDAPNWSIYPIGAAAAFVCTFLFGTHDVGALLFWQQFLIAMLSALSTNRGVSDAAHGTRFATKNPEPKDGQ